MARKIAAKTGTRKTTVRSSKTTAPGHAGVKGKRSKAVELPPIAGIPVQEIHGKSHGSLVTKQGFAPEAQTIIYVHGIGNKPPPSVLKCQWDSALFGVELGDRSRLAYWVNREFYPTPSDDTCDEEDVVAIDDDEISTQSIMSLARGTPTDEDDALEAEVKALTDDPVRQELLRGIGRQMKASPRTDRSARKRSGVSAAMFMQR